MRRREWEAKHLTDLIGSVVTQHIIHAAKRILDDNSAIHSAFAFDRMEQLLERTAERQNLLNVRTVRYKALDHRYTLCQRKIVWVLAPKKKQTGFHKRTVPDHLSSII
jgi:hypothetical protein